MNKIYFIIICCFTFFCKNNFAQTQSTTVIAGSAIGDNKKATSAILRNSLGSAVDALGNIYIADSESHRVRKVDAATNIITTIAGTGVNGYNNDGQRASTAYLNHPRGIAIDGDGNIYIADTYNHRVRKIDAATKMISTIAGTGNTAYNGDDKLATEANLNYPISLAVNGSGDLFIGEAGADRIRKVSAADKKITTIAGTGFAGFSGDGGPATLAKLNWPTGLALDSKGNLFIADASNSRIRMVDLSTTIITTVAGNGTMGFSGDGGFAIDAAFNRPYGIAVDVNGHVYVADGGNNRVRMINMNTGFISTVVGSGSSDGYGDGGLATVAKLLYPVNVSFDADRNMYICEYGRGIIRKVNQSDQIISTKVGIDTSGDIGEGGPAEESILFNPEGIAFDHNSNLYFVDGSGNRVFKIDEISGIISTVAGAGESGYSGDGALATSAKLSNPHDVALDGNGNIFISDGSNHRIRKVDAATGLISTIAGTGEIGYGGDGGLATAALINNPYGIAIDADQNIYFADAHNNCIRKIDHVTKNISTVAGTGTFGYSNDGGLATEAKLRNPYDVTFDNQGNLYLVDWSRVQKVDVTTKIINTVAGLSSSSGGFNGDSGLASELMLGYPTSIAFDAAGDLFIADYSNHRIRKVDLTKGIMTTIVGTGQAGFNGENSNLLQTNINAPFSVAVSPKGKLYFSEKYLIRSVVTKIEQTKIEQTIYFPLLESKQVDGGSFDLTAAANSDLPIHYTSSDINTASVEGKTVTLLAVGETSITATQEGNANYFAAEPVTRILSVIAVVVGAEAGNSTTPASIFPNKSHGIFHVNVPGKCETSFTVQSMQGKRLMAGTLSSEKPAIDLGSFPSGMYIFQLMSCDKSFVFRAVKE